jgi:hypothetical protein
MSDYSPPGVKKTSGLGIASLVLGILGLVIALVMPCLAPLAILLALVGGILGLISVITAATGKKTGIGMPLAGTILNGAAIVVVWLWFGAAVMALIGLGNKLGEEVQKQKEEEKKKYENAKVVILAELLKDYKTDPKKADEKYKDKDLKITAKIKDLTGSYLHFQDPAVDKMTLEVTPSIWQMASLEKDYKKGDEVTVAGKCKGVFGEKVSLSEAVISK